MQLNLFLLSAAALVNATIAIGSVNLGTAESYVILTKTGISTVPESPITGNIAVSPIAATAVTGFGLILDSGGEFSTSSQVTGNVYAADYAVPTPTTLTTAVSDMEIAYTDASSRPNDDGARINLGNGEIGGETLTAGVYTFGSDITIKDHVTFSGAGVYIIQTTGNMLQDGGTMVILLNGALAKNIFWQVAGHVTVGSGADLQGILLVKTDVLFMTGSSLTGRVFAQTACNLQAAPITEP